MILLTMGGSVRVTYFAYTFIERYGTNTAAIEDCPKSCSNYQGNNSQNRSNNVHPKANAHLN